MKAASLFAPFAVLLSAAALAQGPLSPPPGVPAPVMKSLDQIEARTPLVAGQPGVTINASGNISITQPGSYYLTGNLTCTDTTTAHFITLAANNVTLDLNGFTISGTTGNMGDAINGTGFGYRICNGHILGGTTQTGGMFTTKGFYTGISIFTGSLSNGPDSIITDVIVRGVRNRGISTAFECTVDRCLTDTTGGIGIFAGIIRACRAVNAGSHAIQGVNISDSTGKSLGDSSNGITRYPGETAMVSNSVGVAVSGVGIDCSNATNCSGTSSSGPGIYADSSAMNCHGKTSSGTEALRASVATNCTAFHNASGTAIVATVANGCLSLKGTNTITNKYNMP